MIGRVLIRHRTEIILWVTLSIFTAAKATTTTSTTVPPSPTLMTIQKSVSFEARSGKAWGNEPLIMEMLPNDSYFPINPKNKPPPELTSTSTTVAPTSSAGPSTESSASNEVGELQQQASSLSYSTRWQPFEQNLVQGTTGNMYFPAPSLYGYPVNTYGPRVINVGGPSVHYQPPTAVAPLKETPPVVALPQEKQGPTNYYHIPVKSVEYVLPLKSEYGQVEKEPQYNAVRKPFDEPKHYDDSSDAAGSHGQVLANYGSTGQAGPVYGTPAHEFNNYAPSGPVQVNHGSPPLPTYGAPSAPVENYGVPQIQLGSGPSPSYVPAVAYGPPATHGGPTSVKKHVHNVHQKVLHRYNHHQKVLHEHNLHRYIVHNYHLHRYHVHNYHNHKEHVHVNKEHVHEKHQQKVTEEHKQKQTQGETHQHVTEVKESQRHLPAIQGPMHIVKPQWSLFG